MFVTVGVDAHVVPQLMTDAANPMDQVLSKAG
jgi:hypothetical protein